MLNVYWGVKREVDALSAKGLSILQEMQRFLKAVAYIPDKEETWWRKEVLSRSHVVLNELTSLQGKCATLLLKYEELERECTILERDFITLMNKASVPNTTSLCVKPGAEAAAEYEVEGDVHSGNVCLGISEGLMTPHVVAPSESCKDVALTVCNPSGHDITSMYAFATRPETVQDVFGQLRWSSTGLYESIASVRQAVLDSKSMYAVKSRVPHWLDSLREDLQTLEYKYCTALWKRD